MNEIARHKQPTDADPLRDAVRKIYAAMTYEFGDSFTRSFTETRTANGWMRHLHSQILDGQYTADDLLMGYKRAVLAAKGYPPNIPQLVQAARDVLCERIRFSPYAKLPKPVGDKAKGGDALRQVSELLKCKPSNSQ